MGDIEYVAAARAEANAAQLAQIAQVPDTTANRPTDVSVGCMFYDTTLNQPVWLKSKTPDVWIDASGATV